MNASEFFVLTNRRNPDPQFFERSAWRSWRFAGLSFMVLLAVAEGIILLARHGVALPSTAIGYVVLACVGLLLLWGRAWLEHARLRAQLYGAPLNAELREALRVAASALESSLFYASLIAGFLFLAIHQALR